MKKVFLIAVLVLTLAGAGWAAGQQLFFQDWKIEKATPMGNGILQVLYRNPDQTVAIKAVVAAVIPDGTFLGYWYFDPDPKVYILDKEKGKFLFNAEIAKTCVDCHTKGKKI
jgi:hypothetical protein